MCLCLLGIGSTAERDSLPIKSNGDLWYNIDIPGMEIYHAHSATWYRYNY